ERAVGRDSQEVLREDALLVRGQAGRLAPPSPLCRDLQTPTSLRFTMVAEASAWRALRAPRKKAVAARFSIPPSASGLRPLLNSTRGPRRKARHYRPQLPAEE